MADAGIVVFACRYVKTGSGPTAVDGACYASISDAPVSILDPGGAGSAGDADAMLTHLAKSVTIFGKNRQALRALLGADAGQVIIGTYGAGGALEKCTLKSVRFTEVPQEYQIQAKDAGGKVPLWGIRGRVLFAAGETDADVEVWAADVA